MKSHWQCSFAYCANLQRTANLDILWGQQICKLPIRWSQNRVLTSPFTCGKILCAETEEMKSDHERLGVARGVKGEKGAVVLCRSRVSALRRSRADRGHLKRLFTLHQRAEKKRQGLSGVPNSYRAPTCCTSHPKHL